VARSIEFTKGLLALSLLLILAGFLFVPKTHAASLIDVSDTVTTSRPSAAATISANLVSGATAAQIGDRGDMYLASDSAIIYPDLGETFEKIVVASNSASNVPVPGHKMVYFTTAFGSNHHVGDALIVNITATHTINFTPNAAIPSGGHIILTFPTTSANTASPSATGFSFNGFNTGNIGTVIRCYPATACGGTGQSVAGNTITLTTTGAISVPVFISVGCNGTLSATGACGTPSPVLINPTVLVNQCSGQTCTAGATNDIWKIGIQTTDASSSFLDFAKALVATIQSVQVQAQVEPTLTFSITGMNDATNYTTGSSTNCGSESTNTGINSTATSINFGILTPAQINRAGQILTVTTNQAFGYDIVATSSGRLINAASGISLPDANGGSGLTSNLLPAPAAMVAGTAAFGISPCGNDVAGVTGISWGPTGTIAGGTALLANPWNSAGNSFGMALANYTGGPSDGFTGGGAGHHGVTVVRYGAAIGTTTASGLYTTVLTYTATPSF
jgi:hypothetical protein